MNSKVFGATRRVTIKILNHYPAALGNVIQEATRSLIDKVICELEKGESICSLSAPEQIQKDDLQSVEIRRTVKIERLVRCKDCVYYHKAHVKLNDGAELDYDSEVVKEYKQKRKESGDPFWDMVCADLGMNVGGRCERDNNQGYAEDKAVFRHETDFCSKGRAKMEVQE